MTGRKRGTDSLFSSLPFCVCVCVCDVVQRQEVEDERMSRRRREVDQEETELERLGERGRERGSGGGHVGDVQYCSSNDAEPTPLATILSLYTF